MTAFFSSGSAPTSALETTTGEISSFVLLPPTSSRQGFVIAEISYYQPQKGTDVLEVATATTPTAAVTLNPFAPEVINKIYVSDLGYISRPTDSIGQIVYEPILTSGWRLDKTARIEPWASSGSVSWGALSFINADGRHTATADNSSPDGRSVVIKIGQKQYDSSRGIFVDPPYASLNVVFSGVANGLMRKTENGIDVDIRDAGYQGENSIQRAIYGGTGGYDGSLNIKGSPLPFCRGGTASNPIQNVTPIMIDPVNNIWQYNDGPGTIVNLYENSGEVFTYGGDTTDLYSGTTSSGAYRTDNSRGLFQLGSPSVGAITADVTGSFSTAGLQSTAANIARYILTETIGVDSSYIDVGSFIGLNGDRPYTAGIYLIEPTDGLSVVDYLLRSVNAWLSPTSNGFLQAVSVTAPGVLPSVGTYTDRDIVRCISRPMPASLSPPPYRIRLAHSKRYTVQTDTFAGATDESRKQFVSEPWSYTTWIDPSNLITYRGLNDPPPIETPLLIESEAQSVVEQVGSFFGTRRAMYDLEMPGYLAGIHEIGQNITISYGDILPNPVNAVIVGESIDSTRSVFTLKVIV